MLRMPCGAILFDMDGVLVNSQAVVRRTWRRWSERVGLDAETVWYAAQGRRTVDTLQAIATGLDVEAEARWLEDAELTDPEGIVAVPGARELTDAVPDGRWAVVTSAGHELARRRFEWAGLPLPACVVAAGQVSRGKPSPEGYLRAAKELDMLPGDCIVIEDAPVGVQAARAAGMSVIGLTTTHRADEMPPVDALLLDLRGVSVRVHASGLMLSVGGLGGAS